MRSGGLDRHPGYLCAATDQEESGQVTTSERWSTDTMGSAPSVPHGGTLIERRLDAGEAEELAARPLPSLTLTPAETADLRALATGAYSPLTGFMNAKEHEACAEAMRLPDGTPRPSWSTAPPTPSTPAWPACSPRRGGR